MGQCSALDNITNLGLPVSEKADESRETRSPHSIPIYSTTPRF